MEQLAQIHKKTPLTHHQFHTNDYHSHDQQQQQQHRLYNANITLNSVDASSRLPNGMMHSINEDTIIPIGGGVGGIDSNQIKTKDLDTMSMASSTHFTVVNGMGGPQRVAKDGLCSRGHQITVLILTMSLMFLIGISAAVFMLESKSMHKLTPKVIETFYRFLQFLQSSTNIHTNIRKIVALDLAFTLVDAHIFVSKSKSSTSSDIEAIFVDWKCVAYLK